MVPVAFEEVWKVAQSVHGYFGEEEARVLHQLALATPIDQTIVEVGCYHGRSTIVLAASGRRVVTFDPMQIGYNVSDKKIEDDDVKMLQENLTWWANVEWKRENVQDADDFDEPVSFLHVDGRHDGLWPRTDYERFEPCMVKGAKVFFHDYIDAPSVRSCVDTLVAEKRLTLQQAVCGAVVCRVNGTESEGDVLGV